ncbi:hypothetical protein HELRODRAFT_161492 [Helobdella robusta]|uniref:Uncharacterized protein n=1 Tax=Helobdella robusta TaxID=6412 RepID=T1ERJ6_HELRO|nr:hypothetical protein HELRODRAFT_161492 [Helobdella robusta]ESO02247.1 hypothetical protein HELRODRAFT_161492 [Helobdella robusta]
MACQMSQPPINIETSAECLVGTSTPYIELAENSNSNRNDNNNAQGFHFMRNAFSEKLFTAGLLNCVDCVFNCGIVETSLRLAANLASTFFDGNNAKRKHETWHGKHQAGNIDDEDEENDEDEDVDGEDARDIESGNLVKDDADYKMKDKEKERKRMRERKKMRKKLIRMMKKMTKKRKKKRKKKMMTRQSHHSHLPSCKQVHQSDKYAFHKNNISLKNDHRAYTANQHINRTFSSSNPKHTMVK